MDRILTRYIEIFMKVVNIIVDYLMIDGVTKEENRVI